jgi:hypothetical protein
MARLPTLRGRPIRWAMVLQFVVAAAREGQKRWERLSKPEQQELMRIVRKSRGRVSNLAARERDELWRLVRKIAAFDD